MSVQLWILKILKSKAFGQKTTYSKEFFKNPSMNYGSAKSAKIVHSKSIFDVKSQLNFFKKKLRLRPNLLSKRLGGRSLSRLMKNFGLGLLTD